jgi:hypothetical protein
MNSVVFLEWFENQLMPALKNPSLVVLDNASYHNVKTEDTVVNQTLTSRICMQNNQTFAFTRGYFWGIGPIIRKPHIICAVILVNLCFIHVHNIIPCFLKSIDACSEKS